MTITRDCGTYVDEYVKYKFKNVTIKQKIGYRKSSIRSRPCIILNPKFPRLVLEVFQ